VPAIIREIAEVGPIASCRDDPQGVAEPSKQVAIHADLRRQAG
jgi:hypothetical protein